MKSQQQKMVNKKILYAAAGIAIAAIISVLVATGSPKDNVMSFTAYEETNKILREELSEHQILMSSPIKLKEQEDIGKYCSFFTDEEMQKLVQLCTSTELKDIDGNFLGNIHMVGSEEPKIIMVLIQADPFMSEIDYVKTTINTTIQNVVCECWEDVKPDNFPTVGHWIDGLREFHLGDTQPHSKSKELDLRDKTLQLELTTNKDGYLWQFFIYS